MEVVSTTQATLPYQIWNLGPTNPKIPGNDRRRQFPTRLSTSGTAIYQNEDQKMS